MQDEISLLQDVQTFSCQLSEALLQSRSQSRSRSQSSTFSSLLLQTISPQQGEPSTLHQTCHGRLTSIDECLHRTPEVEGDEEDNSDQVTGSPTSPSFGACSSFLSIFGTGLSSFCLSSWD
ncbi:hypothetical protein EJ02DRAFT_96166 [Clathrospora elynae]|uniref:Uncharacterized protein n=1 Tax=Clathrospora elynae TaxID=706981 RepID=A0A6A5SFY6_9PLEO|nr:hypothetical protein EJ02DRAFT_96166 [Clathrospora elynae]